MSHYNGQSNRCRFCSSIKRIIRVCRLWKFGCKIASYRSGHNGDYQRFFFLFTISQRYQNSFGQDGRPEICSAGGLRRVKINEGKMTLQCILLGHRHTSTQPNTGNDNIFDNTKLDSNRLLERKYHPQRCIEFVIFEQSSFLCFYQ